MILLAIALFAYQLLSYRFGQEYNLERIGILHLILPYFFIFPLLGMMSFGLLETTPEMAQTIHDHNLRDELSRKLIEVEDWDEMTTTLFQFITHHLPLTGLSLLVYNQISKKYEIVAERPSGWETEPTIRCLPLILGGKQIALLYLYLSPDRSYPPAHINTIESLGPEIALAIERVHLQSLLEEKTRAIQKKEQDRIAKHLHDTIGHDLAYLRLKLDQLSSSEYLNDSVEFHQEIARMHSVANNAFEQIRSLLRELQEERSIPSDTDLVAHVKECALLVGARANFKLNFKTEGEEKILPPQMQRQILYLVREILRNIEKHADAENAILIFNWMENGLIIKLSDDGRGFDAAVGQKKEGHYGLRIVQEIVDELNGSLSLVSNQNEGTQITLRLPFN